MKLLSQNRSVIEIYDEILTLCQQSCSQMQIMYGVGLSYKQVQQHIKRLIALDFLVGAHLPASPWGKEKITYHTTERGRRFLELWQPMKEMLMEKVIVK